MIGKQKKGESSKFIYRMAQRSITDDLGEKKVADVGCGRGEFTQWIAEQTNRSVVAVDWTPPIHLESKFEHVEIRKSDLNEKWPIEDSEVDIVYALEVIEHVENSRHFMREIKRILREGGQAFVSTPNNESLFSKINFFLTGQHRYFQDSCYPAHINPVLEDDIKKICIENNLELKEVIFSGISTIPKVGVQLKIGGKLFSGNIGFRIQKTS